MTDAMQKLYDERLAQGEADTWIDVEQALNYGLATEVPSMKSPSTVTVFL